jgi:RimJ/RimL family protein N-acetyltransferase
MIETVHLTLIPCELAHLDAARRGIPELGRLLDVAVADGCPVFPESLQYWRDLLAADPSVSGWCNWLFVHRRDRTLAGDGGFKGPPASDGSVEIGYALAPGYRGRGLATEAARALTAWALGHPEVTAVRAETLVDGYASMRVLAKVGMTRIGTRDDPEDGTLIQWAMRRDAP